MDTIDTLSKALDTMETTINPTGVDAQTSGSSFWIILLYIVLGIILICGITLLCFRLQKKKTISYDTILDWLKPWVEQNGKAGMSANLTRLSDLPAEIRQQILKESGFARLLYGYSQENSIVVVITDGDKVICTHYFLGHNIEETLSATIPQPGIHRINI